MKIHNDLVLEWSAHTDILQCTQEINPYLKSEPHRATVSMSNFVLRYGYWRVYLCARVSGEIFPFMPFTN